ncbi:RNA-directed DNA polymerase, eukaryota, reverse transcriptase zinc-binding domain protein [Tanacetum coccineum]
MSTKRRPKRKVKVSIKYNDTVSDLTKKKSRNHDVTSDEEVETERVEDLVVNGVSGDDTYCSSMEYNAYDTEFPSLNKQNELNNKDCNNKELSKENVEEANSSSYDNGVSNNNTEKVSEPKDDVNKNDKEMESNRYKTFANMMRSDNDENENKLNLIPLCVKDGREGVILDEELVKEGSRKWSLTLCGHFFRESDGMEFVLENGSWMIKLHNVPLEAWTSNGISAIASGLGKPLIMDKTTTKMCRGGIGNFRYARVLVEIQADKEFKDKIKICYRNKTQRTKCSEFVKVEYSWKPLKCCESKVFGHTENTCGLKSGNECIAKKGVWNKKNDKEDNGFRKVRYGNNNTKPAAKMGNGLGQGKPQGIKVGKARMEYRPLIKQTTNNQTLPIVESSHNLSSSKDKDKATQSPKQSGSRWRISNENIEELRRSANKFSILEEIHDCEDPEEQMLIEKEIMDKFVKNQRQPTIEDSSKWTAGMFKYFKELWKSKWINECPDEEDIFDEVNGFSKKIAAWNVRGMCNRDMQKDVKKLIRDENLSICVVLETHIKEKKINKICDFVLGGSCKTSDMIYFQECHEHIQVEDLNSSGIHFTWIQSRQDHSSGILKKIDRVLGNIEFMSYFSNSHALFLPHLTFDHSPAVLIIPKDHWNTNVEGCHMYKLVKRMKGLKYHMKKFSWKFGNIFEKVIEWKEKLQIIQRKVYQDPHNATLKKHEADILKEYYKNSKFFHSVTKGSAHRIRIEIVNDKNGVRYEGDQVAEQFVNHFHNFLGKAVDVQNFDLETLKSKTVCVEDVEIMVMHVSDMEIKEALFDICDNKAPGLDGYSAKFFKCAWSVIKNKVCDAVKEIFRTGKMLGEINATLITLVPKRKTLKKVSNYRHIACCNTLYKVISKILTNRIKSALCKLVSSTQSAFIPGRQITDNILLTQELLRGYNWENGARRVALKIDITTAFTISINNERSGYFKGGRGLRQGDPISPYIFTLVMEVFTLILQSQISKDAKLKYHWGCKDLKISHLCFADDLLVLYHGDLNFVKVVKRALDLFSSISGLNQNFGKRKAKVAWKQVCKPKDEGGLESLWVKWIKVIRLKGKSIWDIEYDKNSSHGWKQILSLRDKMRNQVSCKVRDGTKIFLWHDRWWGPFPLINSILMEAICQVGLDPNSKIKDMISEGKWKWPSEWSNSFCNKLPITVPSLSDEAKDLFMWETNDGKCYNYSTRRA